MITCLLPPSKLQPAPAFDVQEYNSAIMTAKDKHGLRLLSLGAVTFEALAS